MVEKALDIIPSVGVSIGGDDEDILWYYGRDESDATATLMARAQWQGRGMAVQRISDNWNDIFLRKDDIKMIISGRSPARVRTHARNRADKTSR